VAGVFLALGIVGTVVNALGGGDDGKGTQGNIGSPAASSGPRAGSSSAASPSKPPPAPVAERHPNIQLPTSYHLDFTDDPLVPSSGIDDDFHFGCSPFGDDCYFSSYHSDLVLLDRGRPGTLDSCLSDTRFATTIEQARLSPGSHICARTDYGSVVLLTFKRGSSSNEVSDYVVFDVTIWRNAIPAEDD
jgi:hypothetical protein